MTNLGCIVTFIFVFVWSPSFCAFGAVKPNDCFLPSEVGQCEGKIKRYFYDPADGKCKTFEYGGCGGNENNFNTLPQCQRKCSDVCSLPKKAGPCEGAFDAYYFNKSPGRCEHFTFGGCDANANNFQTLEECKRECPDVNSHCLEPEDRGGAVNYVVRWMFDSKTWDCVPFVYGGAGGNNNNFMSKKACMDNCPINDICRLPPDSGICEAAMTRWHYDAVSDKCKEFKYGGCLGNDNNFESKLACQLRCPRESICAMPKVGEIPEPKKDETPKFLPRYYYDVKLESCRYFRYSANGGNENNFDSIEKCELHCPFLNRCAKPALSGKGSASLLKWYYDIENGQCDFFVYLGKGGNDNRFSTKRECQTECIGCNQEKDPGPCHGFFRKWHFDPKDEKCETFIFGGCHGNKNNFASREECVTRCA